MMKQFLNKLKIKILDGVAEALLDIACVHEIGMSPLERNNLLPLLDPVQGEARIMSGLARLKREEANQSNQMQWR